MRHFTLITLLFLSINAFGQKSPMDIYEDKMKEEYRLHHIATITDYILNHKEIGKSEFVLNGRRYKMKVKDSKVSGGYVRSDNTKESEWVEGESLQFCVKHMHREYVYTLYGNKLKLWSDNLSFIALYDFDKKEVSIRKIRDMYNASFPKMYGYDYSYVENKLEKVEDWVVRDAIGRANSMK
jgi:hypothetical protein